MDDPNITMEEYIRLEEEKARRHSRTFNWQTATFWKIENYEDENDYFIDFKTKFSAIVFNNTLTAIPSEPTYHICGIALDDDDVIDVPSLDSRYKPKKSFGLREVGFYYRLPILRPLIDAYAVSISSGECKCLSIREGKEEDQVLMIILKEDWCLDSCHESLSMFLIKIARMEDDGDEAYFISLDSRFNAKKVMRG
ncbi:hypothetical protein Tco_0296036 [Tanacetum coccineum]